MTTITITLREVFPDAAEDDVCVKFDADVNADGVKWNLTSVVGVVAGFRQDMEQDCDPQSIPAFPSDFIWVPVSGTDYDNDASMLELLFDATWTALIQWSAASGGDPASGLPSETIVEYHE
jgi:hypothetical protein